MQGFYEFFARGGMARAGLDEGWQCLYALRSSLSQDRTPRSPGSWSVRSLAPARTLLGPYLSFLHGPGFRVFAPVVYSRITSMVARYRTRHDIRPWCRHEDLAVEHLDMRTRNSWRAGLRKRVST